MKQFRRLGLLFAAMFALAAFVPAVASAGEGEINITGSNPCPIEYTYTGSVPGSGEIEDIESSGCTYMGIPISVESDSNVIATFGPSPANTIAISGTVHARIFGVIDCYYNITVPATGTYDPATGTFSATGGTAVAVPPSNSSCPTPLSPISVSGTYP